MKNIQKFAKNLLAVVFGFGLVLSASSAQAGLTPNLTSWTATNITQTSAVLNGVVNPNGSNTTAWFNIQGNSNQLGSQNIGGGNSNVTLQPFTLTGLTPNTTYSFGISATNAVGTTNSSFISFTTTGNPQGSAPVVSVSVSPNPITSGNSATLTWSSTNNPTSCTASWTNNSISTSGSIQVSPTVSTTYTVTCTNAFGTDTKSTTLTVTQIINPPTVNLTASQYSVTYGGSTNLNWSVNNATSCNGSNGINGWSGPKSINGGTFYTGALTSTTTYTIICTNANGQNATDSVTVSVDNQNTTPTVTTNSATNVTYNNANLNGYVNANGGNSVYAWFEWGTNSNYGNTTNQTSYGSTSGTNFTYYLGGLSANTTYYFRAVAQNTNGQIVYGNQMYFTTPSNYVPPTNNPSVTTYYATNTNENSATLNGYVETNGAYITRWFEWGTNTNSLYNSTNKITQGTSSGNFSQYISGLSANTTYYFRAVAQGNNGNVYGNVSSFTTTGNYYNPNTCNTNISCAPTAITTIATNLDQNSARLNGLGLVNSGTNVSTNGYFEWGTTQNLGNVTTTGYIGSSSSNPFYASLFGLSSNTTYYFRAVVQNQYGIARGDIASFRTNTVIINTVPRIIYRNTTVVTNTATQTTPQIDNTRGVSKPSLVFLSVTQASESIRLGESVDYFVNYKNVSAENLKDVVLRVSIPKELAFVSTTNGYLSSENNTVIVNVGDLYPQQEGGLRITTQVLNTAQIGKLIVVTGNLPYTISRDNTQEEVFAYSKATVTDGINTSVNRNVNLSGAALFGTGFWPNTLFGWLILLLLILLLVLIARMLYRRREIAVSPFATTTTKKETTTHTEHNM